jgi:hypothetical protein
VGTEGLPYLVKQGKVENHVFLQSVGWNVCLDRRSNETRGFQWTKWGLLKKRIASWLDYSQEPWRRQLLSTVTV